jgi:hypothetical protein
MEIKITTRQVLLVLQVISWMVFLGILVDAGAIIVNTFITLFIKPSGVQNFWDGADYLTSIHSFNRNHFTTLAIIMIIVGVLKAIMFWCIVRLFAESKLSISQPFSTELTKFMLNMSYLTLGIGIFCLGGSNFTQWLTGQGLRTAPVNELHIGGADVWLFMAIVLFIIVQVVKRGVELQNENDLTI